jgi:hypothetical protein
MLLMLVLLMLVDITRLWPMVPARYMRIVIQHSKTGHYFSKGRTWSRNPADALAFLDEVRALDYCIYNRIEQASVVTLPKHGSPPVTPERGTALLPPNPPQPHQNTMKSKPTENIKPTTRQPQNLAPATSAPRSGLKAVVSTPAPAPLKESAANGKLSKTRKTARPSTVKPVVPEKKPVTLEAKRSLPEAKPAGVEAKTAAPKAPPAARPAPQTPSAVILPPQPVEKVTTIEARIDVGLGNALFIRGESAGLSWDKGLPLECAGPSSWCWSTTQAAEKLEFKLLLNDQLWSQGGNLTVEAGKKIEINPVFE